MLGFIFISDFMKYDPRKPTMHSIHREEDDSRTMSPEMDKWRKKQFEQIMDEGRKRQRAMNRCLRAMLYAGHGDVTEVCREMGIPLHEVRREYARVAAHGGCKGANFPMPNVKDEPRAPAPC
jgi:hypothetical protein